MKKIIFILASIYVSSLTAAELGQLTISGKGCEDSKKEILVQKSAENEKKIEVPLHYKLIKTNANSLERKVCQFSIPIKLKKDVKIQVSQLSQNVKVSHAKDTLIKSEMSLFFAGLKKPKSFELELKASDPKPSLETQWREEVVFIESECGKDVMMRGNINAFASGAGEASAEAQELHLSIKTIECKN